MSAWKNGLLICFPDMRGFVRKIKCWRLYDKMCAHCCARRSLLIVNYFNLSHCTAVCKELLRQLNREPASNRVHPIEDSSKRCLRLLPVDLLVCCIPSCHPSPSPVLLYFVLRLFLCYLCVLSGEYIWSPSFICYAHTWANNVSIQYFQNMICMIICICQDCVLVLYLCT